MESGYHHSWCLILILGESFKRNVQNQTSWKMNYFKPLKGLSCFKALYIEFYRENKKLFIKCNSDISEFGKSIGFKANFRTLQRLLDHL